jgi:kynurenine formamidase
VVKNLVNLEAVSVPSFIFSCLPLRAPGSDCSPTRAVAIEI